MRNKTLVFLLSITIIACKHQANYSSIKDVLERKEIGKEFLSHNDSVSEIKAIYLGEVEMNGEEKIQVVNFISLIGDRKESRKANCKIAFYDSDNNFIGSYYVGAIWDLPSKLEKGFLIFKPSSECKTGDKVDLKDSIPHSLFVKCNGDMGNIYTLSRDQDD